MQLWIENVGTGDTVMQYFVEGNTSSYQTSTTNILPWASNSGPYFAWAIHTLQYLNYRLYT